MSATGKPHVLIITHVPAEGEYEADVEFEIEHNDDCPTDTHVCGLSDIPLLEYTCGVGYEILNVGLEGLECRSVEGWAEPTEHNPFGMYDWKGLPEGRYIIQAWHTYHTYCNEYDAGLELLGREGEVVAA